MGENREPNPSQSIDITIGFRQPHLGRFEDWLELTFEDTQIRSRFVIIRSLKAVVGDQQAYESLMPISPYVPRVKEVARPILKHVVDGERPPALNSMPYVIKLPLAKIPKPLRDLLDSDGPTSLRVRRRFLPPILQAGTYANHFRHLIWAEEHQMKYATSSSSYLLG